MNNKTSYVNDEIYKKLLQMSRGEGVDLPASTGNNVYDAYRNAESIYNGMKCMDINGMSDGQLSVYQQLLGNTYDSMNKSKTAYQQYLDNENSAVKSKNDQFIAQQNALRNVQMGLASQGLGTQGIAESIRAGIGSNYANNISQIDSARQSSNDRIYQALMGDIQKNDVDNVSKLIEGRNADYTQIGSMAEAMLENAKGMNSFAELDKVYGSFFSRLNPAQQEMFKQQYDIAKELVGDRILTTLDDKSIARLQKGERMEIGGVVYEPYTKADGSLGLRPYKETPNNETNGTNKKYTYDMLKDDVKVQSSNNKAVYENDSKEFKDIVGKDYSNIKGISDGKLYKKNGKYYQVRTHSEKNKYGAKTYYLQQISKEEYDSLKK